VPIDRNSVVRPSAGVVVRAISDGSVIVDIERGRCWELNREAHWIWEQIGLRRTVAEVSSGLAARYGIPIERASHDVLELVAALHEEGIVAVDVGARQQD
jgi:hypothetical protein